MYCGHIAIGLAAKTARPRLPIWVLLLAAFGPDWVETALMAAGFGPTALFSHSIPAVAIGSTACGVLVGMWRRSRRDAALVAAVYLSHLLVDFITGNKPLGFGGLKFGAQLYNYPILDFMLESTFIVVGWLVYLRSLPLQQVAGRKPIHYLLPVSLVFLQGFYDRFFAHT